MIWVIGTTILWHASLRSLAGTSSVPVALPSESDFSCFNIYSSLTRWNLNLSLSSKSSLFEFWCVMFGILPANFGPTVAKWSFNTLVMFFGSVHSLSSVLTLSSLPLFLCPGWSNFTWIKAVTIKCTYLYNHAIYFNQTSLKLGKQSELSNYTGKLDDLWPSSRSRDPIWPPNAISKCQN